MNAVESFKKVEEISELSADVMRAACFQYHAEIPFELIIKGGGAINLELESLFMASTDVRATMLDLLEPLEREGLIKINRENDTYSTTEDIVNQLTINDDLFP